MEDMLSYHVLSHGTVPSQGLFSLSAASLAHQPIANIPSFQSHIHLLAAGNFKSLHVSL